MLSARLCSTGSVVSLCSKSHPLTDCELEVQRLEPRAAGVYTGVSHPCCVTVLLCTDIPMKRPTRSHPPGTQRWRRRRCAFSMTAQLSQ